MLSDIFENHIGQGGHLRRPTIPGERFISHAVATSELYVQAIESHQCGALELVQFEAESRAWMPDGNGGLLKPDAFMIVAKGDNVDSWAVEVDKATEHRPALRRKFETYISFMRRGQLAPNGVMPRVLITCPDEARRSVVQDVIERFSRDVQGVFSVSAEADAMAFVLSTLDT